MADYFKANLDAKKNIEELQKIINSASFYNDEEYPARERKKIFATLFALRATVNAVRKKPATLEMNVNPEAMKANVQALMKNKSFDSFIKDKGLNAMKDLTVAGHGGAAEDAFKEYMMQQPKLDYTLGNRYLPTVADRIETLQKKLEGVNPNSPEAYQYASEIFRARRSIEAQPDNLYMLKSNQVNADNIAKLPNYDKLPCFKAFMKKKGKEFIAAIQKGHGGKAEEMFSEYIQNLDHLPKDAPKHYAGTAMKRIEILQKKIKNAKDLKTRQALALELMATRKSIEAKRGDKKSLDKDFDPKVMRTKLEAMAKDDLYKGFMAKTPEKILLSAAEDGHGGALEDLFKDYLANIEHLPANAPKEYMPNGDERISNLQDKVGQKAFENISDERKEGLYIEILATRLCLEAKRNQPETLHKPIDPVELNKQIAKLKKCKMLKDFIAKDPAKARKLIQQGHGGAFEDAFKNYVKTADHIEGSVPDQYMPTGKERTEALQDKIKSSGFKYKSPEEQNKIYLELVATRSAVSAVRGDKKSLEVPLISNKLGKAYKQIGNSSEWKGFMEEPSRDLLKDAATSGHGGALEDQFKGHVGIEIIKNGGTSAQFDERYCPAPKETLATVKKDLKEYGKKDTAWINANQDLIKTKVATAMYLMKENMTQPDKKGDFEVDYKLMHKNVNILKNSKQFDRMLQRTSLQGAVDAVNSGNFTIFEKFNQANLQLFPGRENFHVLEAQQQNLQQNQQPNLQQNDPNLQNPQPQPQLQPHP